MREEHLYRRLVDAEEIKQLKARYFRIIDTKDWDAWRDLFTADARIEAVGLRMAPDEFVAVTRTWIGDATTVHTGGMPEVVITGPDTATGIWAMHDMIRFPEDGREPRGMDGYGHYHEQYRRIDGRWHIEAMTLTRLRVDLLSGGVPDV
jgi:hypothetical protein